MEQDFDSRVAIVTGAGRGIGRSIAQALAARGARVAVAARTARYGEEAVAAIRAAGGACTCWWPTSASVWPRQRNAAAASIS